MISRVPRAAAIHSMAGFGRSSLSVIMPAMSVMGVQVCPIPTTVMSSHTGGLGEVESRDLSDYIRPCAEHYKRLDIDFEAIYSGFLSSAAQAGEVSALIQAYPNALAVVDPVMGDHGKLYRTYTPELVNATCELVKHANVITPNVTEAALLLGEKFWQGSLSSQQLKSILARLARLGPDYVVITGVDVAARGSACVGYDRSHNAYWCAPYRHVPVAYPGTGDLFASVLTGGMMTGDSFPMAMSRAAWFVGLAVKTTFSYGEDTRYGVMLEKCLPALAQRQSSEDFELL